jgi:predicted nucleic acid-binding Zn ribbon protein
VSECGKVFERNLHFSDNQSMVICPVGHKHVHKSFQFLPWCIRQRFYVTDHRKSAGTSQK